MRKFKDTILKIAYELIFWYSVSFEKTIDNLEIYDSLEIVFKVFYSVWYPNWHYAKVNQVLPNMMVFNNLFLLMNYCKIFEQSSYKFKSY